MTYLPLNVFVFSNYNIALKNDASAVCTYKYQNSIMLITITKILITITIVITLKIIIISKKTKLRNSLAILISTILIKNIDINQQWNNIGRLDWSYPSAKLLTSMSFQNVNQPITFTATLHEYWFHSEKDQ